MFWDSSAIIPYLAREKRSEEIISMLSEDTNPAIWWYTPIECASVLDRKRRAGDLLPSQYNEARSRLLDMIEKVDIIEAHTLVRQRAIRLLTSHPLSATDSMQLAAALVYCDEQPISEPFVCLDARLGQAAEREGFTLLPQDVPR